MPEQVEQTPDTAVAQSHIERLAERGKERFQARRQILSFDEYFAEVTKTPQRHTRDAAHYLRDAFEHFGSYEVRGQAGMVRRFKIFDAPWQEGATPLLGQEQLQNDVYRHLVSFCEKGRIDKLLMIHGPNGTAKSTFVECLIGALRAYSELPEGARYRFNWVWSDTADRSALGFMEKPDRETDSLAHLPPDEVTFKLGDELKDHPLLLIPKQDRIELLTALFEEVGETPRIPAFLAHGDLSAKNTEIYRALYNAYEGDWKKLVHHVQVERLYVSQRYRSCAVVIQPQRNVDASSRPLNLEKSYRLPPILNQSSLSELSGDLIDGNRGVVEYSDFFKRPLELTKYLLTTSEKGSISLPDTTAYLDCLFFATANEKNLTLFKRNPDFPSFKGRFELIRAPYMLRYSVEQNLYRERLPALADTKHVAPHVTHVVALWAVLTRLRRPRGKHYQGELGGLVTRLRPLDKARLYDSHTPPAEWVDVDRKELRAHLAQIASEFDNAEEEFEGIIDAAYEGRRGASPREIMNMLHQAAQDPDLPCLSPLAVLKAIREVCEDKSLYEFLRQSHEAGYGDIPQLTDDVEGEYRRLVRDEVHRSLALVEETAYDQLFEDYFKHVKAFDGGEKIMSPITKRPEDPDARLMAKVEELVGIGDEEPATFRKNLIVRIAAWVIDNPGQPIPYQEVFSDILQALRESYYKEREAAVEQIQQQLLRYGTEDWSMVEPADQKRVIEAMDTLKTYGYCDHCAKEALNYVLRHRGES